jgi:hypothetical protein
VPTYILNNVGGTLNYDTPVDLGDLDDDPYNPDGVYWVANDDGTDTFMRAGFENPSDDLLAGDNLQEYQVHVVKVDTLDGNDPTLTIALYNGATPVRDLLTDEPIGNDPAGYTFSVFWNANELTQISGNAAAIGITGNRSGGGPTVRRVAVVGAVRWISTEDTGGVTHQGEGIVDGDATVDDATAEVDHQAIADVTGSAIVTLATASMTRGDFADVTGIATVTLATGAIKKLAEAEAAGLAVASALAEVDHQAVAGVTGVATVDASAHLNIILGVPFAPDFEATVINFTGSYLDIDEDPYDIDANWMDVVDETSVCFGIFDLPDSLQYKVVRAVGLHSLAVTVRKNASGGTDPTVAAQMFDNAAGREIVVDNETVTSLTSEVHTGTFGLIHDLDYINLPFLRVAISGTSSGDRNIDIAAMRVYLAMEGTRIKSSVSGAATVTLADGGLIKIGAASVSGAATITDATGGIIHPAAASVTGVATVTLATADVLKIGAADVTGVATVTLATAEVLHIAAATVSGVATVTLATAKVDLQAIGSVTGVGDIDADANLTLRVLASVTGIATVTLATATMEYSASASVAGAATITDAGGGLRFDAAADVTGAATITDATAEVDHSAIASVTGICTITDATGDTGGFKQGEADVTGTATITDATAEVLHIASASVTGVATITDATGDVGGIQDGAASVTGTATVTLATAIVEYSANASVTGIATVTLATAKVLHSAGASVAGAATISARAHMNIILGVPFAPSAHLNNINFSNGSSGWEQIDDDPFDIDANWLDIVDETSLGFYISELPSSLQYKAIRGIDLHTAVITVRKNASGGTDPDTTLSIFEGGNSREHPILSETVTDLVSEIHSGTFSLLDVTDLTEFNTGVRSNTSGDRGVDVAAVRVYLAMEGTRIAASVTGVATITDATGDILGGIQVGAADVTGIAATTGDLTGTYSADAAVTGVGAISADADLTLVGVTSVTGVCTVNAKPGIKLSTAAASVTGEAILDPDYSHGWLNIIPDRPFAPIADRAGFGYTGTFDFVDEDPYDIDDNWVTVDNPSGNSNYIVDFVDAAWLKAVHAPNAHNFAITVRKNAAGGTDPVRLNVRNTDGPVQRETIIDDETVTNIVSEVHTGTFSLLWAFANLTFPSGSNNLRIAVLGKTSGDRNLDIAAFRMYMSLEGTRGNASVTGTATAIATGGIVVSANANVTGIAAVSANAIIKRSAIASVTGVASVSAEPDLIEAIILGRIIFEARIFKSIESKTNIYKSIRTSSELTKSIYTMSEVA